MTKEDLVSKLKSGEITGEDIVKAFDEEYGQSGRRRYIPPSVEEIKNTYASNEILRLRALTENVPFITPEIDEFKLTQGLIIVGGKTGQGKSTTLANIMAGFVQNRPPEDKAIIITNEESTEAVYSRIACVLLKTSFKSFYNDRLPKVEADKIKSVATSLIGRVVVEEGNGQFDMTCLEDVKDALVYAAEGGYKIATIDYFQTVTWSREFPQMSAVEVSKSLGFFFKDYGRKAPIPVIAFAQLRPSSDKTPEDFSARIQNDRTIANHAFINVEVIPDFEKKTTTFKIWKDRHGFSQGKEYEFYFNGGKYELVF